MAAGDVPSLGARLQRMARFAGLALLALSLVYIAREVARHWPEIAAWRPNAIDLLKLGTLAFLYGAMLYLLAETWHRLVVVFGPESRHRTWRSYTLTQIARYLPGNVAHLLGRAVALRGGPLSVRQLGLATLLELITVPVGAIVALVLAVLLAPGGAEIAVELGWPGTTGSLLAVAAMTLIGAVASLAIVCRRGGVGRQFVVALCFALPLCTLFMAGLGMIFGAIVGIVGAGPFWAAAMAGICAWLVGYATPGAPGGLGPREAMLLLLLSDTMPAGDLVIAVAVFRIVTIAGDLLCFVSGAVLLRDGAPAMR